MGPSIDLGGARGQAVPAAMGRVVHSQEVTDVFIGHFAPALVAAAHVEKTGQARVLGGMFIAAQLVDFAFFILVLLGVEQFRIVPGITAMNPLDLYLMPFTHSLAGTLGWAGLFALLTALFLRDMRFAILGAGVVLSHWFLDLLVHRPDLTLVGEAPKLGLGLWNVPWAIVPLELLMTLGAFFYYAVKTRQRDGKTDHALYTLLVVLVIVQLLNWYGPTPENGPMEVCFQALIVFTILVLLAAWLGSTREYWRMKDLEPPSAMPTRS
ncbi:hypothetical protein QQS45_12205 [Alteriqipengyuania flavescens]|uniref:hypothetical protein n=1 Tax=Alteriqipengyuania flavescens TaxID=3053610 RepID=UPI0025B3E684|nr:hypothetical protein [Alteriqipengyuania flavescens]WJY18370.1 hypothetical protein QQW98_12200 [Alteriqipengyuania flavescens]WJY24311.1 hypothetical protein QQS45_12205 [Alteriqipengyuania flavescens]